MAVARITKKTKQFLDNLYHCENYQKNPTNFAKYYQLDITSQPDKYNQYVGIIISSRNSALLVSISHTEPNKLYIPSKVNLRHFNIFDIIIDDEYIIIKRKDNINEVKYKYNRVIDLAEYYKNNIEKTEEIKMEKINETVVAPATIEEVTVAPTIPAEAFAGTDSVAPSMVATASPITSVADFLAMVHGSKTTGIADGRIKLSLDEVMERLGGTITVQKIEQCANEGRNFFVVQLSEQTYMYSFKMMTTIIAKWVQACGGVDGLNKMLSQTEIKMKLSKSEYMGKTYTRCDVI